MWYPSLRQLLISYICSIVKVYSLVAQVITNIWLTAITFYNIEWQDFVLYPLSALLYVFLWKEVLKGSLYHSIMK